MAINYYNDYLKLFEFGKRTQAQYVKMHPQNFYRISRYTNVSGDSKSMAGKDSSLVFVIGTYDNKINCIKLNEVKPMIFINWVSTILKPTLTSEIINNMGLFSEIVIPSDKTGNVLFESKIRTNVIYKQDPRPYRTYNLDGLKYIQQIQLNSEILTGLI